MPMKRVSKRRYSAVHYSGLRDTSGRSRYVELFSAGYFIRAAPRDGEISVTDVPLSEYHAV